MGDLATLTTETGMKHKRLLVGILAGVLILLLVLLAAGYFMVDYALKPGELWTACARSMP